jgi:DUF971 family protein
MADIFPVKIKKTDDKTIEIVWNNGTIKNLSIEKLRDECPCVNCKGESVIFDNYIPIKSPFKAAGFYEIEKIEPIGNYAVQIYWKDGHNTGIFNWDLLWELCNN